MLSTVNSSYQVNQIPKRNQQTRQNSNTQLVSFRATDGKDELVVREDTAKFKPVTSFAKGLIRPIKEVAQAIIEKPAQSALVIGFTAAIVRCVKPARLLLSGLVAGYGSYRIGSGLLNARKELKAGDKEQANKSIENVGEGVFDVSLSAISINKSIAAIKETKAAVKAATQGGKALTTAQKVYTALMFPAKSADVTKLKDGATVKDALKLVGTEGWQAIKDFKNGVQGKVTEGVTKTADSIKSGQLKTDILKVTGKVKNFFKDINFKNLGQLAVYAERLEDTAVDAINTLEKMDGVDLINLIDSVREEPDSLVALKELKRRGKLDPVAEQITRTIGNNRYQEVEVKDKYGPISKD
ncbi:MAG: hypothetical protein AB1782_16085 [Cyanobacteriota bacterium]